MCEQILAATAKNAPQKLKSHEYYQKNKKTGEKTWEEMREKKPIR